LRARDNEDVFII